MRWLPFPVSALPTSGTCQLRRKILETGAWVYIIIISIKQCSHSLLTWS